MSTRGSEAALPLAQTLAQLARFVVSGGLSAAVDFGALSLLLMLRTPRPAATSTAFLIGALVNFALHHRFTFRSATRWTLVQLVRFGLVVLLNMVITTGLVELLSGQLAVPVLYAKAITLPVVALNGFFLARRFVFPTVAHARRPAG